MVREICCTSTEDNPASSVQGTFLCTEDYDTFLLKEGGFYSLL